MSAGRYSQDDGHMPPDDRMRRAGAQKMHAPGRHFSVTASRCGSAAERDKLIHDPLCHPESRIT